MRPLAPKGGNDDVWTPDWLAAHIVAHFKPRGNMLEPCKGGGAFTRAMPGCEWCEIKEGRNFLHGWSSDVHFDWIVTNPPWSQFRPFLNRSMRLADNIVFLSLLNAWYMKARLNDMRDCNFGFVETLMIDTPPKPWPQTGFQLAAVHIQRGYRGAVKINY